MSLQQVESWFKMPARFAALVGELNPRALKVYPQLLALTNLWRAGGPVISPTAQDISKRCRVPAEKVGKALGELAEKKLIQFETECGKRWKIRVLGLGTPLPSWQETPAKTEGGTLAAVAGEDTTSPAAQDADLQASPAESSEKNLEEETLPREGAGEGPASLDPETQAKLKQLAEQVAPVVAQAIHRPVSPTEVRTDLDRLVDQVRCLRVRSVRHLVARIREAVDERVSTWPAAAGPIRGWGALRKAVASYLALDDAQLREEEAVRERMVRRDLEYAGPEEARATAWRLGMAQLAEEMARMVPSSRGESPARGIGSIAGSASAPAPCP